MTANEERLAGIEIRLDERDGVLVDRRTHSCGCVTVFHLGGWESVAVHRCQDHRREG